MERRQFLRLSIHSGVLALAYLVGFGCQAKKHRRAIELSDLPYGYDALEPYISGRTISLHYGKHHRGYVDKTNGLITGTPYENLPLVDIIKQTCGKEKDLTIFNNAAQVFNHTFYWNSMKPAGGRIPAGPVAKRIEDAFGNLESFYRAFYDAAKSQFGSGWVWVISDNNRLDIVTTTNADTPVAHGVVPVLALDVWEHAYYLDYQNRRSDYVKAFLGNLLNWDFVQANLGHDSHKQQSQA